MGEKGAGRRRRERRPGSKSARKKESGALKLMGPSMRANASPLTYRLVYASNNVRGVNNERTNETTDRPSNPRLSLSLFLPTLPQPRRSTSDLSAAKKSYRFVLSELVCTFLAIRPVPSINPSPGSSGRTIPIGPLHFSHRA